MLIGKYSSSAHELMLQFLVVLLGRVREDVLPHRVEAQRAPTAVPKGPRKGSLALAECETRGHGMQVRPAAWCGAVRVRDHGWDDGLAVPSAGHFAERHTQQLTLGGPLTTTHAHAYRTAGQ